MLDGTINVGLSQETAVCFSFPVDSQHRPAQALPDPNHRLITVIMMMTERKCLFEPKQ